MPNWRKQFWPLCCAALLLQAPVYAAENTSEQPQQKLQATLKSLQSSKQDEEALKARLEAAQEAQEKLKESATDLADQLQHSEANASREETRYQHISAQLAAKQKEFDARAEEYAQTLRSMLHMQHIPATALIATPQNVDQLLRTTSALRYVNVALKARALELKNETVALRSLQESAAASRQSLDKTLKQLQTQQQALSSDIVKRQKLQADLARDHAAALAKVDTLSKQSQSLQDLITKLEKNSQKIAVAGSTPSQKLPPSAAKGSWRIPVAGAIIHHFGDRKNANENWRGWVMRARSGGTVVAPSAGEVVFTGPFRDYGRMVLIKHKDRHISLLAGLGSINVTLNQQIGRGEPLGSMDNTGNSELYLELREDGKPVDPAGWYANVHASD